MTCGIHQSGRIIFEDILLKDSLNSEVEKNLVLTYLAKKEYDAALVLFEKLASRIDLFTNKGMFLQSKALLKRANSQDIYLSEILLNDVVNMQLAGHF